MERTVCELFAGVGGFRLGLERESKEWNTVWFSQWEPGKIKQWAHDCYVSHWGDIDEYTGCDIATVDKSHIPDHNLLVGGFPCQDYSVARPLYGSQGIEGKKGVLWWQIRDVLKEKSPAFAIFENVDRLLKSPAKQRGRDFGIILACLAEQGYSAEWRVINAADYGAGQRRRRVFIFAYRNNTSYAQTINKTEPLDVIASVGMMSKAFPVYETGQMLFSQLEYDDLVEISDTFKFPFDNAGFMSDGMIYTVNVTPVSEEPITLSQMAESNVDDKYYIGNNIEKWEFLKGSKKITRTTKSGYEYVFSEGAIAFPDYMDKPARTMLTSESSLNRSTHVIPDPCTGKLRILTPVEAERIQGFDDNWTDTGMPEKFRYFCMGNALVVPMITRMAKELDEIFNLEE